MSKQSAFFASRILGHKLLSGASRTARRRRSAGFQARLEPLESRHLLAANILAEISSTVDGSSNSRDIDLTVSLPDATSSNATAMLMIRAMAADGSAFDPGAPVVVGKTSSDSVSTLASHDDVDGTAGVTMVQISAGDFTLQFAGDGDAATTGGFTAQVFLVGDVMNADGIVTQDEHTLATAALIQTLGTGNFVTQLFYESLGIDLSQDLYDAGMDGDGNGEIGPADLEAIEHNLGVGMVQVELQSDADAPVISGLALQNDTGVSNTDRITTNPTVVATVSDESEIASLLAGVNAAPTVDILSSLNTTNGILTLDRAALETINGGTLVDGSVTLQLLATDALGNAMATPATLTFTLITTNQSPISAGIADQTATEDQAFTQNLSAIFSDPNTGDQLTLSVGTLPAWLSFNATTRTLSGTPANGDVGTTSITVTATDSQGATASSTYDLTVVNVNDAPV
ncbi:MAG: putative Ig domain-containing protein, partial [Planctomycetales bacterium]|nr:putative Ig domain-containing protein [Planctomycetales bacterium]